MFAGEDETADIAMIEFETKDDALAALIRDQKSFDGNTIEVQLDAGSTLWVTNFPPTADEAYMRDLFSKVSYLRRLCIV